MADHANDFSSLPPEYQEVLRHAREIHGIEITPLQELKGGRTEACLYLVSVTPANAKKIEHFILKLDHKSKKTDLDELKRHQSALSKAPSDFARQGDMR